MAQKQESSFRELALNYRVNQERSCKEVKGLVCNLTRYNDRREWPRNRRMGKVSSRSVEIITVIVTKSGWNRPG